MVNPANDEGVVFMFLEFMNQFGRRVEDCHVAREVAECDLVAGTDTAADDGVVADFWEGSEELVISALLQVCLDYGQWTYR